MSEKQVIDRIKHIHFLCEQIDSDMLKARQQGRMPTMNESRKMDQLSAELLEEIQNLPPAAWSLVADPMQKEARQILAQVRETLRSALDHTANPAQPARKTGVPQAAPGRLSSYCTC